MKVLLLILFLRHWSYPFFHFSAGRSLISSQQVKEVFLKKSPLPLGDMFRAPNSPSTLPSILSASILTGQKQKQEKKKSSLKTVFQIEPQQY